MTSLVRRGLGLLLPVLLPACAVAAGEPLANELAINRCQADADCSGLGLCVGGICQGSHGEFESLLVAVTPAASDARFAGVTLYKAFPDDGSSLPPGGANGQDIDVRQSVHLTGGVHVDPCVGSMFIPTQGQSFPGGLDGSIPADVSFTPSQLVLGLPTEVYRATVAANGFTFGVSLPPGEYDVYIRPFRQSVEMGKTTCPAPPRLLLHQTIDKNLDFKLAPPAPLPVRVIWPADTSLVDWSVDLADQDSGRSLSIQRAVIAEDRVDQTDHDQTYELSLDYAPVYGPDAKGTLQPLSIGTAVVRLTPPSGVTAPVLMGQLSGLKIGDPAEPTPAVLRQSTALPSAVSVEVQTDLAGDGTPIPAVVSLIATELNPATELSTAFSRTLTIGASGANTVELLPGTYKVLAAPSVACTTTSCPASIETTWVVAPSPAMQAGRLIEFSDAIELYGRAVIANGEAAVGATVRAVASPSVIDYNIFNRGDGAAQVLPRAAFGLVDADGGFSFRTDPGTFDLRVEPDPTTGFGWYVRPRVALDAASTNVDLERLTLSLPIVYRGRVTTGSPDAPTGIASALIRAFVYVGSDGKVLSQPTAGAVAVQVAETHADAAGDYTLLVPPTLDGG